jgi:tetratricopeptide (TPR) repeat protein
MPGTRASQLYRTQRLSRACSIARLPAVLLAVTATLGAASPPQSDALARARLLYNQQQYDQAIAAAEGAVRIPTLADSARLVIGRCYLERFRQTASPQDLEAGRNALRQVQAARLPAGERAELLVGLGESLYLDNAFGAASEIFSSALGPSTPDDVRDSVLGWWASSLDRLALTRAPDDREDIYAQIVTRMEEELERSASSTSAAYWLAAASRGAGNLERAWNAAIAGWVRALLSPLRGAALRADLDHLVETAIIPERAREMGTDRERAVASLRAEWEGIKQNWK